MFHGLASLGRVRFILAQPWDISYTYDTGTDAVQQQPERGSKEAAGPLGVLLVALSQSKQQASFTLVPEHAWSAHSSRSLTRRGAQRPNETLPPYPHGSKISGTYMWLFTYVVSLLIVLLVY